MKAECLSTAQGLYLLTINTLPQTIIENILCLLPIKEAARTSILLREWRYKWTTIPKLEFDCAWENMVPSCKLFNAIHQVLLMRQGPIHEFTFRMLGDCQCVELDQIIFHLSRNHAVKKLTLVLSCMYKLPLCAFSLHQLTDLYLSSVYLGHEPIFSGFGSLRSLSLINVRISTKVILHLLSNCPSLKSFRLNTVENIGSKDCTIVELFECLPVIEHLTTWGDCIEPWLVLDSVPGVQPTSLIHLKHFCFNAMSFDDDHHFTFLAVLIKCSPNLEKIELQVEMDYVYENETCSGILEEFSDVWLEHLKELEIVFFSNSKQEMEFVKFILARSPKLKKVIIYSFVQKDEVSDMLKILLQAPRVSPVEIIVTEMR